jgi:molybdate transport system substrate-binding protein
VGFQQVSELLPIKGISYVGVIPREVEKVTRCSAGIPAASTEAAAARQLIASIAGPVGRPVVKATGLEPLTGD